MLAEWGRWARPSVLHTQFQEQMGQERPKSLYKTRKGCTNRGATHCCCLRPSPGNPDKAWHVVDAQETCWMNGPGLSGRCPSCSSGSGRGVEGEGEPVLGPRVNAVLTHKPNALLGPSCRGWTIWRVPSPLHRLQGLRGDCAPLRCD